MKGYTHFGTPLSMTLIDNDFGYAQALIDYLHTQFTSLRLHYYQHGKHAIEQILNTRTDVVLLDLELTDISGVGVIRILREHNFKGSIIVLSNIQDDDHLYEAFANGAVGYLIKCTTNEKQIVDAITSVQNGAIPASKCLLRRVLQKLYRKRTRMRDVKAFNISHREREVLEMLSKGHSCREISAALSISYHTVRTHQKNLYKKMQVNSIAEAIAKYNNNH